MENSEKKVIGEVIDNSEVNVLFLAEQIGTAKINDIVNVELLLSIKSSPIVKYGSRYYTLSWQEIMELAIDAGLIPEGVL